MIRRPLRTALALVAAVAALGIGGCAAEPDGGPGRDEPSLPDEVSVAVVQNRSDVIPRRLQLRVTNGSERDLEVVSARFDSEAFAEAALWTKGTTIPAGATRDLPVLLPQPSCTGATDAIVELELLADDRRTVRVAVAPDDPVGRLPTLTDAECLLVRAAEVAELRFSSVITPTDGGPAAIVLGTTPAGGAGSLRVVAIRSTNLFTVLDDTGAAVARRELGVVVDGGDAPASTSIALRPSRCDAHALAEDKRGTLFGIELELPDGTAGVAELAADEALRGALYDYFAAYCGL